MTDDDRIQGLVDLLAKLSGLVDKMFAANKKILEQTEIQLARQAGLEMIMVGLCRRAGVSDALVNQFMSIPRTGDNLKAIANVGMWIATALTDKEQPGGR
jgi:hypothetical protein